MRSCGSMLPTRIPRTKSIHSVRNASPVGNSAARSPLFASGSQSLVVMLRFICVRRFPARPEDNLRRRGDRHVEHALKNHPAILAAEQFFTGALGVRHETEYVAGFVADAGDVVERPVRVGGVGDLPVLRAIAKENAALALELLDHLWLGEITALPVRDGEAQHLSFAAGVREW